MDNNIRLYPWFRFFQNLVFWQGIWFLFFQDRLSPAEAILLYAIYDIATTVMEVPSGYLSDQVGRRITLILSGVAGIAGSALLIFGDSFLAFAAAQVLIGAAAAFSSGTDSSLLYESLSSEGRSDEVETHELRAWRAGFVGLAISALTGGLMATADMIWPFIATCAALAVSLVVVLQFQEPMHSKRASDAPSSYHEMLTHPVLAWLFVLSVAMYSLSHVPFVFGQPFILDALTSYGFAAEAPAVSGAVSAAMMIVSVGTSWLATPIRKGIGLGGILLLAIGMQMGLIAALAWSNSVLMIGLMLLRMVPDSFAKPFITARIQPLLQDAKRATYLSLQSFCARLVFAGSLIVFASGTSDTAALPYDELQRILVWYAMAGFAVLLGLALTSAALKRGERPDPSQQR